MAAVASDAQAKADLGSKPLGQFPFASIPDSQLNFMAAPNSVGGQAECRSQLKTDGQSVQANDSASRTDFPQIPNERNLPSVPAPPSATPEFSKFQGTHTSSSGLLVMGGAGAPPTFSAPSSLTPREGKLNGVIPPTTPEQLAAILEQYQFLSSQGFPYMDFPRVSGMPAVNGVNGWHTGFGDLVANMQPPLLPVSYSNGMQGNASNASMGELTSPENPASASANPNPGRKTYADVSRPVPKPGEVPPAQKAQGSEGNPPQEQERSNKHEQPEAATPSEPSTKSSSAQPAHAPHNPILEKYTSNGSSEGIGDIDDLLSRLNPHAKEFVPPPSPVASSPSLPASPHPLLGGPPFLIPPWQFALDSQQQQQILELQQHLHSPMGHQGPLVSPLPLPIVQGGGPPLPLQGQFRRNQQQFGHPGQGRGGRHGAPYRNGQGMGPNVRRPPVAVQGRGSQGDLPAREELSAHMQAERPAVSANGNSNGVGREGVGGPEMERERERDREQREREQRERERERERGGAKNGKFRPEVSIMRTIYVSDLDQQVTEEQLAELFQTCGQVVDCRICGDPNSVLRFAFVEFTDQAAARNALSLAGTVMGSYPLRVLPSKTPIYPVNPKYLPRSDEERELCARTVYVTNIDRKVTQIDVRMFFETLCGEVSKLRLLGDFQHNTRIAFVEFVIAESAIAALNCSGAVLGSLPIRVSPSKTPVRPRMAKQ